MKKTGRSLSDISIHNSVFAWMIMAAMLLFGSISFFRLGLSEKPDVDFPIVSITLSLDGASPQVMESDVVDVLEDALLSVEGVKEIRSSSFHGSAYIKVELELNRDIDTAVNEIQTKISEKKRYLPTDLEPPSIRKQNPDDDPIIWLALTSDKSTKELMLYARDYLKDRIQLIEGVGDIRLGGFVDRNLRIWADAEKLVRYEFTVEDVINAIAKQHSESPAGRLETAKQEITIRSMGEAATVKEIENIIIATRGGRPIYDAKIRIKDVAIVEDGLEEIRRLSRYKGTPSVGLGIIKQKGSNAVKTARNVKKELSELKANLPEGFQLNIANDYTRFIEESIDELQFTLILSAILTAIVIFVFLGSYSATFNIILAIPTSIIGTFFIMDLFGFTMNMFTMLALTLAIGIVVDDSIMVLENIFRFNEKGLNKKEAALKGANQIAFAATATTLSIVAIFLPVAFMKGIIGKYFYEFGVTLSAAVLLSLLEALTLTAMRSSKFNYQSEKKFYLAEKIKNSFDILSTFYKKTLEIALRHPYKTIALSLVFFAGSYIFVFSLKQEMIPPMDQSQLMLRFKTPPGSSLEFTDNMIKLCEKYVDSQEETKGFFAIVGGFHGGMVNSGMMFLHLKPPSERPISKKTGRPLTQNEIMGKLRENLNKIDKNLKVRVQDRTMRGFSTGRGFPVEFTVQGPEWKKLSEYSNLIEKEMTDSGMFADIDTDFEEGMPELKIIPDRKAAAERGVEVAAIGNAVQSLVNGRKVGKFTESGRRYDIRIQLKHTDRKTKEDIGKILVRNNRGELIKLSNLIKYDMKPSLLSINRINRQRAIELHANLTSDISQQDALNKVVELGKKTLPKDYRIVLSGSSQAAQDSFSDLAMALWLGIIISFMILASQFNSFTHPFIILLALPFSFSGALIALFLTGQSINMYSFIGLILLMGLVKKNSIMLVEFTNQIREKEKDIKKALLKASPIRLRPIIMTTIATIAAALPPAMAIGPGAESRIPMAVTVIGGMLISTLITLYVVPAVYSVLPGRDKTTRDKT